MSSSQPVILLVHSDPVVHELLSGTLGDEFTFVVARNGEVAVKLAATHEPAVIVTDTEAGEEAAAALVTKLQASHPHLRAILFAEAREPGKTWRLADHGMVLPRNYELDRLRVSIRKAAKLQAMSHGVERLRADTARTTQRLRSEAVTERLNYVKHNDAAKPATGEVDANSDEPQSSGNR